MSGVLRCGGPRAGLRSASESFPGGSRVSPQGSGFWMCVACCSSTVVPWRRRLSLQDWVQSLQQVPLALRAEVQAFPFPPGPGSTACIPAAPPGVWSLGRAEDTEGAEVSTWVPPLSTQQEAEHPQLLQALRHASLTGSREGRSQAGEGSQPLGLTQRLLSCVWAGAPDAEMKRSPNPLRGAVIRGAVRVSESLCPLKIDFPWLHP